LRGRWLIQRQHLDVGSIARGRDRQQHRESDYRAKTRAERPGMRPQHDCFVFKYDALWVAAIFAKTPATSGSS
jgi:hypothetical protein